MSTFTGSLVPIITPFRDGNLDRDGLERVIEHCLAGGSDGIVPCGTTGESATLTHDEHDTVIRWTVEIVNRRVPVIAGTGSNSTAEAVRLTKAARDLGADGALLISPYYNKPTQEGIYLHYEAVAREASPLPLIVYNIPGRTASKIEPETLGRLARIPNIAGVKEATGSLVQVQEVIELSGENLDVYSGEDPMNFAILAAGGKGLISAVANVVPKEIADLAHACLDARWDEAGRMHRRLLPLVRACFLETNPIPVKTACALMGLCAEEMRLPLTPMRAQHREELQSTLRVFGLIS